MLASLGVFNFVEVIMKQVFVLLFAILIISSFGGQQASAAAGINGLDAERLPEWQVKSMSSGGKLLLSDSPEMVESDGILYQDKVTGSVRLFFYHVNSSPDVKKMAVILENSGDKPAYVNVSQAALAGPGRSWMVVGKQAQLAYLGEKKTYQLTVPPGGRVPLADNIEEEMLMPNTLMNGIYDFTTDRQINVKVLMLPVTENSIEFSRKAQVLPADQYRLRGTFEGANRQITPIEPYDPASDTIMGLTLADNQIDTYLEGIDATDGSQVVNYGNYGVVYQIALPSKKGGRVAYYLAPLGGEYAGAIGINHPDVYWSPLATPRDRLYFGAKKNMDSAFLGTYESGDPLSLVFSPPGASNLPVKIVVVPQ